MLVPVGVPERLGDRMRRENDARAAWRRALCGAIFVVAILFGLWPRVGQAADPPIKLNIIMAGNSLNNFPVLLARRQGFYKEAGLDVHLVNVNGGALAITAVMNGNADLLNAVFDHTIDMQAKKKPMQAIFQIAGVPGAALVVSPRFSDKVKSVKDLAGLTVGASAPGASSDFLVKFLLTKAGVDVTKVPVVGVGIGASSVAALEQGTVAAAAVYDPAVSELLARHPDLRILSDNRDPAVAQAVFGGHYPGTAAYGMTSWIAAHREECRRYAVAMVLTLHWLQSHTAEEIVAAAKEDYPGFDAVVFLNAIKHTMPGWMGSGIIEPQGAAAALAVLRQFLPEVANATIDLDATYDNSFVREAYATLKLPMPQ
jgi:NitT/TauT family transport system substrate-binding protein